MKTVLLTGAEGMIGSHLKTYLIDNGYSVVSFKAMHVNKKTGTNMMFPIT